MVIFFISPLLYGAQPGDSKYLQEPSTRELPSSTAAEAVQSTKDIFQQLLAQIVKETSSSTKDQDEALRIIQEKGACLLDSLSPSEQDEITQAHEQTMAELVSKTVDDEDKDLPEKVGVMLGFMRIAVSHPALFYHAIEKLKNEYAQDIYLSKKESDEIGDQLKSLIGALIAPLEQVRLSSGRTFAAQWLDSITPAQRNQTFQDLVTVVSNQFEQAQTKDNRELLFSLLNAIWVLGDLISSSPLRLQILAAMQKTDPCMSDDIDWLLEEIREEQSKRPL